MCAPLGGFPACLPTGAQICKSIDCQSKDKGRGASWKRESGSRRHTFRRLPRTPGVTGNIVPLLFHRIAERGGAVALFSALHEGWEWRASERRGKGISAQRRPWGERLRAGARFPPFPPRFLPSFRKSSRRVIVGSLVRGSIVGRPAAVPGRGGGGDGGCGAEALACVCVRAGLDEARLCVEIAMASCGARVLGTQMRGMPCRRGRVRSRPATNQSR